MYVIVIMYNICSTQIPESIKASAGQSSIADFHSSPSISFPVPVMRPELRKETDCGWLKETFPCLQRVLQNFMIIFHQLQEVHTKVHVMTVTLELPISLGVWECQKPLSLFLI